MRLSTSSGKTCSGHCPRGKPHHTWLFCAELTKRSVGLRRTPKDWVLKVAGKDMELKDLPSTVKIHLKWAEGTEEKEHKLEFERKSVSPLTYKGLNLHLPQMCGFCLKTGPNSQISHESPDCTKLKTINKHRGKFPPPPSGGHQPAQL